MNSHEAFFARRDRIAEVARRWLPRPPWATEIANTIAGCQPEDGIDEASIVATIQRRREYFGMELAADQVEPLAYALAEAFAASWAEERKAAP